MSYQTFERVPKYSGVWKKLKTVKNGLRLAELLNSYLDERTKIRPEGYTPMPGANHVPLSSGLWVFGHLAKHLASQGVNVAQAQPQPVIEQLTDWWVENREGAVAKAHHITASFDPRISSELYRRGYPVDSMLLSAFQSTLTQYGARFYPGETLGYVVGCHHDTDNPHAHALLHPTTDAGTLLCVSSPREGEPGEDKFVFLRETFNTRARQLFVALTQERVANLPTPEGVNQWQLLSQNAMLAAKPGSIGDTKAAADILREYISTPDIAEVIVPAVKTLTEIIEQGSKGLPTPERVTARCLSIEEEWRASREAHAALALKTHRLHRPSPDRPRYSPLASPGVRPGFQGALGYSQLAAAGNGKNPVDIWDAQRARRKQSDAIRGEVTKVAKAYRESIRGQVSALDQLHVQIGFAAAQVEMGEAMAFGTPPTFLESAMKRTLRTRAVAEQFAEREMLILAEREAVGHRPEDPSKTPSIFATVHGPRFRALSAPATHLTDLTPTI